MSNDITTIDLNLIEDVDARNRETSRREVEAFKTRSAERWFAYVNRTHTAIVTWMGDRLADVTYWGDPFESPAFGRPSTRRNFRAVGIDSRTWSGTYYESSGDYVRMRVVRGR